MSHTLTVELSPEAFAALTRRAADAGVTPDRLAADFLERQYVRRPPADPEAARKRLESYFGSVDLGGPTGADNESIDADLAREYGRGL